MSENKNTLEKIKEQQQKINSKAKKAVEGYKSFAIKGNVVDMAIGVAIGSAFTNIINTIVSSTITPVISLLTNRVDLSTLFISLTGGNYASIEEAKSAGAITLNYGMLLNSILNFLLISIVLFIVICVIKNLNKKSAKNEANLKKTTTKECPYCLSNVPVNASKCAFCTSDLEFKKEVKQKILRSKK